MRPAGVVLPVLFSLHYLAGVFLDRPGPQD